jgi:ABC-type lipoprotein release transport system permease subunit
MALPLAYNWRNLFVRKLSTALTFTVVAVVVFVLTVLLSFAAGIRASLTASGTPRNVIVLKPGSTSESTSIIRPEESARLSQAPGIAADENGALLISHELCVQTSIPRRGPGGRLANVAVRGVTPAAFQVHDDVRVVEGRAFHPGSLEVMVGKAARERYANLQVGGELSIGRFSSRVCRVVGVFEANGGAMESEIWAPLTVLSDAYSRRFISSAVLRLRDPAAAQETIDYLAGPAVDLEAKRETDYYNDLSAKTREIAVLTTILVSIMAVGAVFAVANTMYAAVDGRRREIAMLRTIGFSRASIMIAFVIESLMICLAACACGLAGSLFLNGSRQDFLSNATWTVLAYELRVTPGIMLGALALSAVVGVAGAMAPAVRAARTGVIEALRKA